MQMVQLTLKFENGLLQLRKEDVIVNSTNTNLDLQMNASAKALAEAAGPELQKECSKLAPLNKGEVKVSDAYKLPCKKVLHIHISAESDLENAIMQCLHVVDKELKYKSIAFPVLGTGVLKFRADVVARYFIRCMKKFTSENLSVIYVVIFPRDESIYENFSTVFKQNNESKLSGDEHFMEQFEESVIGDPVITLNIDNDEYLKVEANFRKTIPSSKVTILEIRRIQNFTQWIKYKEHRRHVSKKYGMSNCGVERILWHGTKEDAVQLIANTFFNRSFANKEASKGQGAYFATEAKYSDQDRYSKPNSSGEKYMMQVRVVVGKYAVGSPEMKVPPTSPSGEPCDSVVDNVQSPSMFVVFQDTAAYPEYIVKYKKEA